MEDSKQATTTRKPLVITVAVAAALLAAGLAVPWLLTTSGDDAGTTTTVPPVATTTEASAATTTPVISAATTTTTVPPAIIPVFRATFEPWFPPRMAATSIDEAWIVASPSAIGHWVAGRWDYYGFTESSGDNPLRPECHDCVGVFPPQFHDTAVGSDGVVWAATDLGVFSFDGATWTRRLDSPTGAVAVDGDGTVWTGGLDTSQGEIWLAHEDAGSWLRVDDGGVPQRAFLRIAVFSDGEVWGASCCFGYWGQAVRYDGTSVDDVRFPDTTTILTAFAQAPGGEVWAAGFADYGETGVVARRDGEVWTTLEQHAVRSTLWDIAFDPEGTLWVVGSPGLASFDGTDWTVRAPEAFAMDVLGDGTIVYLEITDGVPEVHTIDPA